MRSRDLVICYKSAWHHHTEEEVERCSTLVPRKYMKVERRNCNNQTGMETKKSVGDDDDKDTGASAHKNQGKVSIV